MNHVYNFIIFTLWSIIFTYLLKWSEIKSDSRSILTTKYQRCTVYAKSLPFLTSLLLKLYLFKIMEWIMIIYKLYIIIFENVTFSDRRITKKVINHPHCMQEQRNYSSGASPWVVGMGEIPHHLPRHVLV